MKGSKWAKQDLNQRRKKRCGFSSPRVTTLPKEKQKEKKNKGGTDFTKSLYTVEGSGRRTSIAKGLGKSECGCRKEKTWTKVPSRILWTCIAIARPSCVTAERGQKKEETHAKWRACHAMGCAFQTEEDYATEEKNKYD